MLGEDDGLLVGIPGLAGVSRIDRVAD